MEPKGEERADFVIVGAGVMGASIACQLAERRPGRILLLDADHVAAGASGRSSALVRMHYAYEPEVRLARLGLEWLEHWQERIGRPTSFRRTGYVRVVAREESDRLRANVAMQRACGVDTHLVGRAELREIAPGWKLDDVELAAWEPGSGYADAATVASDLLERARERGAVYRPRCTVRALRLHGGRVKGVETDRGFVGAGCVTMAAGAWSRRLLAAAGIELPLESEHHDVVVLERRGDPGLHPACGDSTLGIYLRAEGTRQTLVGDLTGPRRPDPEPADPEAKPESVESQVRRAALRIPALGDAGIARTVSGWYTMTPDTRPLLGPLFTVAGLYCCTGFSGMGFKISPAVGVVMSEWILDGESRSVDVSSFRVDRFDRGEAIAPIHEYAALPSVASAALDS